VSSAPTLFFHFLYQISAVFCSCHRFSRVLDLAVQESIFVTRGFSLLLWCALAHSSGLSCCGTSYSKRKKFDSSNKYNNINWNDSSEKGEGKNKYRFRDKKKKKKFQKMMSRTCTTLSDLDFSNDDFSTSEEDERSKCKTGDFTSLCLMSKSSRHISDSDSDVSDDSSPDGLSL
jgi:hypothetical protein